MSRLLRQANRGRRRYQPLSVSIAGEEFVLSSSARLCSCRLIAPGDRYTFSAAWVMLGESITARKNSS